MAERESVGFLGALPVDSELVELLDNEAIAVAEAEAKKQVEESSAVDEATEARTVEHSFDLLARYQRTPTYKLFQEISSEALKRLAELGISSD